MIALVLDPTQATEPPPVEKPVPPEPLPAVTVAKPTKRAEAAFGLAARAGVDVGSLPGVARGAQGGLFVGLGLLRLDVLFGAWLAPSVQGGPHPTSGGDFSLVGGTAHLCGSVWRSAPVGVDVCVGGDVGKMVASSYGIAFPATVESWQSDVALAAVLALRLGRLAYRLGVEAGPVLQKTTLDITGFGAAFRPSDAILRVWLELDLTILGR
jgi:hypothetical protein